MGTKDMTGAYGGDAAAWRFVRLVPGGQQCPDLPDGWQLHTGQDPRSLRWYYALITPDHYELTSAENWPRSAGASLAGTAKARELAGFRETQGDRE